MSPPTPVPAATKRRYQKRNHAAREIRITREVRSLLLNLDDSCQLYLSQCAVLGNPMCPHNEAIDVAAERIHTQAIIHAQAHNLVKAAIRRFPINPSIH